MNTQNLKLKFESDLLYQQEAVSSIVGLFEGFPAANPTNHILPNVNKTNSLQTEYGVANPTPIDGFDNLLLENLRDIQKNNKIIESEYLKGNNFTVEMETGTGKTYVYLRTILELCARYSFTKFVILTPTVAIREGVVSSVRLLKDHFEGIYSLPFEAKVYESKKLTNLREFALSSSLQILIINIDSFNKDINRINIPDDRMSGNLPIEYIQSCRPIVIIDEPQNMESKKSKDAINSLNPMCTFRYSATHKNLYNQVYQLGPVKAHNLKLVKTIEVDSVVGDANLNDAYVELLKLDNRKLRAQIRINTNLENSSKQKQFWVKPGTDLFELSNNRQEYQTGYIVEDIVFRDSEEKIEFNSGKRVGYKEPLGGFTDEIKKQQIKTTIERHLEKERTLKESNEHIKVLSLIFIDRVDKYRIHSTEKDVLGEYAILFEEIYEELRNGRFSELELPCAKQVHGGYFSKDPKGKLRDTFGKSIADVTTYELIMKDKERLLSIEEPLRFIFSHSALREGWDNPNIFQICTLNDSKSTDRKRQEIGRGLRLPVNSMGERIRNDQINRLTVVANEAYEDFAAKLQKEYEEDTGITFGVLQFTSFCDVANPFPNTNTSYHSLTPDQSKEIFDHLVIAEILYEDGTVTSAFRPLDSHFSLTVPPGYEPVREEITDVISQYITPVKISNARRRNRIKFQKNVLLDESFQDLWKRISRKTRYRVSLNTDKLIEESLRELEKLPAIEPLKIRISSAQIDPKLAGITATRSRATREFNTDTSIYLPDILTKLQSELDLTRLTLRKILISSNYFSNFRTNPQKFCEQVSTVIKKVMTTQIAEGIRYEEIAGASWEMRQLETGLEFERYADRLYQVQNLRKTPYDYIEFDSSVEKKFAEELDNLDEVKFYIKLPSWFKIDTPLGGYNPDWAIMFDKDDKSALYFVCETKSALDPAQRRPSENSKIDCAVKHFETIDVDYEIATEVDDLKALREWQNST